MGRPAVKKQLIEDAAISLIATHGLPGTTIKQIALAAGVTEGALYRHYQGKYEMAWSLYCREVAVFTEAFQPVLADGHAPLPERLRTAVEFIYRYYEDQPHRLVFVLMTRQGFPEQFLVDENVDPDVVLIRFIANEIAKGNIRDEDPTLLMSMVRGLVLEPIYMHRYGRLAKSPIELAGPVADACVRVLAA